MVAKRTCSRGGAQSSTTSSLPSTRSLIKVGFGLGIGSLLATILFMIVAAALFIPGFIIVKKQHKKAKEERDKSLLITGYVMMVLGMVVGLGFGASAMFSLLGEDI